MEARPNNDALARSEFVAGREAYENRDYEVALAKFRRAHELSGRPQLLFNIGQAADRLRHDDEAIEAFTAFIEALPDHPSRAEAEDRKTRLLAARRTPETQVIIQEREVRVEDEPTVFESPWFWTAVGVVVVGAVVVAILLAQPGEEDPFDGNIGQVSGLRVAF